MQLSELVRLSLAEDIGQGDVTTELTVPAGRRGRAIVRAKEPLVACGHAPAAEVFRQLGASYRPLVQEGPLLERGAAVAEVEGELSALLTGERTALNFLMRLSGIATWTREVSQHLPAGLRLVDTRKTTPLHRALERRAVRIGGAANHRFALYDGVPIKDNHIAAAGGITAAVRGARAGAHHLLRVEVEVSSLDQAREAAEAGADALLLDNMSNEAMAEVARALPALLLEASGNLSPERLATLGGLGLHLASMGGLIHQARWADLNMKISAVGP
jgi:nicotinate-nucleotide pyrophosphorylase (carboxylating)